MRFIPLISSVVFLTACLTTQGATSAPNPAPEAATPSAAPATPQTSSVPPAAAPQVVLVPTTLERPDPSAISEFPKLPQPSPQASVSQTVGITALEIKYSSPGVKGREIFGGLVPFDKPWRTGANAPTTLEVNRPLKVGGKDVEPGVYSIFTVPGKSAWKVILNRDPERKGVYAHDPKLDVAILQVKPETIAPRERMTFLFANTTDTQTELILEWSTTRVGIPMSTDTEKLVEEEIGNTFAQAWRPLYSAARHYAGKKDYPRAVGLFEQSIGIQPTFWNHFFLASTLKDQGDDQGAKKHAAEAIKLGTGAAVFERAFRKRAEAMVEAGDSKAPAGE